MLKELAGDAALDRFRAEYEKVFRALKKSHDSEKRLIKKCRELNAEIVSGAAKVQAALKLSDEDRATIAALKKEIENSWRVVDSSHEKVRWAHEQPPATQLTWQGGRRRMGWHRVWPSLAFLSRPFASPPLLASCAGAEGQGAGCGPEAGDLRADQAAGTGAGQAACAVLLLTA